MRRHVRQLTGKETMPQVESFANGEQRLINKLGKEEYLKMLWDVQREERKGVKIRPFSPEEILRCRREKKRGVLYEFK